MGGPCNKNPFCDCAALYDIKTVFASHPHPSPYSVTTFSP
jgi:hypothetical protein